MTSLPASAARVPCLPGNPWSLPMQEYAMMAEGMGRCIRGESRDCGGNQQGGQGEVGDGMKECMQEISRKRRLQVMRVR